MQDPSVVTIVVGLVLVGVIAWNALQNARLVFFIVRAAVEHRTVRGYWSAYFEHHVDGQYSRLVGIVLAGAAYLLVLPVVALATLLSRTRVQAKPDSKSLSHK